MDKPRKIFVAIPSQADAVKINTMLCVMDAMVDALTKGWAFEVHGYAGITPISSARNYAMAEFLASDCDDLVYLDDDLAWEKGALLRLLSHPVDFVVGVYPYRVDPVSFPIRWPTEGGEIWSDPETHLIEIAGCGFGFARMTRTVVEQMVAAYSNLSYPEKGCPNDKAWLLFQLDVVIDGIKYSEDMIFAKRWREIGGKVWCDPEILFIHIGNKGFPGHFGNFLRQQAKCTWTPPTSWKMQSAA